MEKVSKLRHVLFLFCGLILLYGILTLPAGWLRSLYADNSTIIEHMRNFVYQTPPYYGANYAGYRFIYQPVSALLFIPILEAAPQQQFLVLILLTIILSLVGAWAWSKSLELLDYFNRKASWVFILLLPLLHWQGNISELREYPAWTYAGLSFLALVSRKYFIAGLMGAAFILEHGVSIVFVVPIMMSLTIANFYKIFPLFHPKRWKTYLPMMYLFLGSVSTIIVLAVYYTGTINIIDAVRGYYHTLAMSPVGRPIGLGLFKYIYKSLFTFPEWSIRSLLINIILCSSFAFYRQKTELYISGLLILLFLFLLPVGWGNPFYSSYITFFLLIGFSAAYGVCVPQKFINSANKYSVALIILIWGIFYYNRVRLPFVSVAKVIPDFISYNRQYHLAWKNLSHGMHFISHSDRFFLPYSNSQFIIYNHFRNTDYYKTALQEKFIINSQEGKVYLWYSSLPYSSSHPTLSSSASENTQVANLFKDIGLQITSETVAWKDINITVTLITLDKYDK